MLARLSTTSICHAKQRCHLSIFFYTCKASVERKKELKRENQWLSVLLFFNSRLLIKARPFLVRILDKKPLLRFLTRCEGSNVSLLAPLACRRVVVVEELGRAGSSRVVESDSVEVGVLGRTGRLAESRENVRLEEVEVLVGDAV
jgi:hypothetical protein